MRKGFDGLAALVQQRLRQDPFGGAVYAFRGERGDLVKLLWWDGHADDTPVPVPVLAPGAGRTKTGRLWTYVRDERGAAGQASPAVLFRYAPDCKAERPAEHLQAFRGDLHADGYAGFDRLYGGQIAEVACWAHVRHKFFEVHAATGSATAREALDHIAASMRSSTTCAADHPTSDDASARPAPARCSGRSAAGST